MPIVGHQTGAPAATNPYPAGQCTWGVWQYVYDQFQVAMPDLPGNAEAWAADARHNGWSVGSTPQVNTIVCWGTSKYPPDGHVAFVTAVDAGGTPTAQTPNVSEGTVTVYEANFDKRAPYPPGNIDGYNYTDTRTYRVGSSDADGIQGYIVPPGIQPGDTVPGTGPSDTSSNDPWSGLTQSLEAALAPAEKQAAAEVEAAAQKAISGAQMVGGAGLMAGGGLLLFFGFRGQRPPVPAFASRPARPLSEASPETAGYTRAQLEGGSEADQAANQELLARGRRYPGTVSARQVGARGRPETPPPERAPIERGRDFVFGADSRVAMSARAKIARGQVASMTPQETAWMTENPGQARAAFERAKVSSRVTTAGRARILVER